LNDSPDIAFLRDYPGPRNEALLCSISPGRSEIEAAEKRLHDALDRVPTAQLTARFGLEATMEKYGKPDVFEIHEDKFHYDLLGLLKDAKLAWMHRTNTIPGTWWCVHPELGGALMSVIAIAAARSVGLDIVTEEMTLHHALAALDEQTVLTELLQGALPTHPTPSETQSVDQLAHIVLTTRFDLSSLSMKEVAELVRDGNDLREFRKALSGFAGAVPPDASAERREKLLIGQAQQIIEIWQKQKRTWPRRLLNTIREGTATDAENEVKNVAAELAKAAAVGGLGALGGAVLSPIILPAAAGIGLGAIFAVGRALFSGDSRVGPYRYLTRVAKGGASLLVVPKQYHSAPPAEP